MGYLLTLISYPTSKSLVFDALQHWRSDKSLILDVKQKNQLSVAVTVRYWLYCDTQVSWLRQWVIWKRWHIRAYLDTRDWRVAQTDPGLWRRLCSQQGPGAGVCIVRWRHRLGWGWWSSGSEAHWAPGLHSSHWHPPQKGQIWPWSAGILLEMVLPEGMDERGWWFVSGRGELCYEDNMQCCRDGLRSRDRALVLKWGQILPSFELFTLCWLKL